MIRALIKWPEGIDPSEGAAQGSVKSPSGTDNRNLSSLCYKIGAQHSTVLSELGITDAYVLGRSVESITEAVKDYIKKKGKRPTTKTSSAWLNNDAYLRRRKSSLKTVCDEVEGVAPRTVASLKVEVLIFFKRERIRPTSATSKIWASHAAWLRNKDCSLTELCDDLKLPGTVVLGRSVKAIEVEVMAYFKKTGKRPTAKVSKHWANHEAWLFRQKPSLSLFKLCNKLGIAGSYQKDRSEEGIEAEARAYMNRTGVRPKVTTSSRWTNHNAWLYAKGSSLTEFLDAKGFPGGREYNRSLSGIKSEAKAFFKSTGVRPTQRTSPHWRRHDQWLRGQGTSLHMVCDQLKLS